MQLNHNLEAMARLLYDQWFVQFDFPDENGNPYKSSGGKMVWNEKLKRKIPEGWKVQTLSEHANIIMGSSPEGISLNEDGRGVVFFQGCADFGAVFPEERVYTTQPKRMAIEGSVLISVRAPVGQQNIAEKECCIGRGVAALTSKFDTPAYLWQEIAHLSYFFDRYNGEGSIFGCINKDELHSLPVLTSPTIINKYEEAIGSIYLKRLSIARETKKLQLHRDFLLPLLMNGQVTVTPQGEVLNYDLTSFFLLAVEWE